MAREIWVVEHRLRSKWVIWTTYGGKDAKESAAHYIKLCKAKKNFRVVRYIPARRGDAEREGK